MSKYKKALAKWKREKGKRQKKINKKAKKLCLPDNPIAIFTFDFAD